MTTTNCAAISRATLAAAGIGCITALIEDSLISQYVSALPDRREGYLRAMADLLCMVADGVLPSEGWSPLRNTQPACNRDAA